jgi:hypothetical protein
MNHWETGHSWDEPLQLDQFPPKFETTPERIDQVKLLDYKYNDGKGS